MQPRRPSRDGPASDDERAAARLVAGDLQRRLRRFWRSWPTAPRCKLCHRPFAGPGGRVMRLVGLGPWPGNPTYCRGCFRALYRDRAGAEISCALLFADVRDSTAMAEGLRPAEFRRRMDRFYATAFEVLVAHDAFVDKFVGDEVIGVFIPALTDGPPARAAIDAGLEMLRATGHGAGAAWVPIGIGVNAGIAYVGAVGTAEHVEFTALGDVVNVAARLSASAAAGEMWATDAAVAAAAIDVTPLDRRRVVLKGRAEPTDVVVLAVDSGPLTPPADAPGGT